MKYAMVKFKKSGVTIRTVVTEAERRELRSKNTLDGIAVERFRFEGKDGQSHRFDFQLNGEYAHIMKALRQAYGIPKLSKVFRRMIIDIVLQFGSRPRPKGLTKLQREGYLYLEKAAIELAKEVKRHGKKRIRRPNRRLASRR